MSKLKLTMEVESNDTDENRRQSSISFKDNGNRQGSVTFKDNENLKEVEPTSPTPQVPKKFINNWRHACDRTKDRTKELLKKWRTLPEAGQTGQMEGSTGSQSSEGNATNNTKWSEHVWTTWVRRSPSGEECLQNNIECTNITEIQRKKFQHFFISYLDLDRDDVISLTDFDAFSERLRHFSEWSKNSPEYHRLKEVQRGFIETFLLPDNIDVPVCSYEVLEKKIKKEQLSLEQWLKKWDNILSGCQNFFELPLWLQYFPKIVFQAINRSGSGFVTKDELSAFFSSLLGLTTSQIGAFANEAYDILTSNNQHPLAYSVYRFCFANFIFARYPNGPGQFIFGPIAGIENSSFPIDYKTLTCSPQELEQYSPKVKSNRSSIVV